MPARYLVLVLLMSMLITTTSAQETGERLINRKSLGILVEYGQPYYYLPEGDYRYYVVLFGTPFSFPLFRAKKVFNLSVDLYPHFGHAWVTNDKTYIEFGLNVRLGLNFALSDKDVISGKIGSGPHYVTVETEKQANGFIFSDYFLLTYKRAFRIDKKPFTVDVEFGYRHISNAGLKMPNRSISNFIFGLGIYRCF